MKREFQKMPRKKPLEISKEFVDQVLAIIANESEVGRKKIIAIARRAEEKYDLPVKSWLTGWFYQYTRTRGEKVEQSITVMKNFPDAYTRLQEFKLMISEGEWNVGSYNYLLFLELIDAVPDYASVEEPLIHAFILELKDLIIKQIDVFMAQYKATLKSIKDREIERQAMGQTERQVIENILVFNNITTAKEALSTQQDKIVFSLIFKNDLWNLSWIDDDEEIYPLSPSNELIQKLATLVKPDIEKINEIGLKGIKRECIKARDQYLSKIQLIINPEDKNSHTSLTNEQLATNGVTSTFVLRHAEKETSLFWINSIGVPNKLDLTQKEKLSSWLTTHAAPFNHEDILHLKANLLQVKTTQPFSANKLESMNEMMANVFKRSTHNAEPVQDKNIGKLDLKLFGDLKHHLEDRAKKIKKNTSSDSTSEPTPTRSLPNKLKPEQYTVSSQLPTFWQRHKTINEVEEEHHTLNHSSKK